MCCIAVPQSCGAGGGYIPAPQDMEYHEYLRNHFNMKEGSIVPRRGNVPKREILPDPVYNSVMVTKLINSVMLDGKKGVAQKVVYDAFDIIKEKSGKEPL